MLADSGVTDAAIIGGLATAVVGLAKFTHWLILRALAAADNRIHDLETENERLRLENARLVALQLGDTADPTYPAEPPPVAGD